MKDPDTLMELIHREKERKISVRLEQLAEEFSEQLEVQRRKLEEDYGGLSIFYILGVYKTLFDIAAAFLLYSEEEYQLHGEFVRQD